MTTPRDLRAEDLLEHAAWIRRLARRLVGEDAEDLVQETWLAALRRPPASNRPLRPWLATVARNLALNRRRGRARRIARETAVGAEERPLPSPEELLERGEEQRAVVDAVLGLDEPVRGTLLLRYFEGLEPREIAARQGVPGATVRARLKRGVDRVRERLDAQNDGDRARWVRALAPLAGLDRGDAEVALASTTTVTTLTMATTLKLAAAAVVAAGTLGWFLREGTPDSRTLLAPGGSSSPARLDGTVDSASQRPPDATRVAVVGSAAVAAATETTTPATGELLVLDARTGEPVPDWPLGVAVETTPPDPLVVSETSPVGARYATDASGRVTLARDVAAVHDLDVWQAKRALAERSGGGSPSLGDPLPIDWSESPTTLRVPVGPTFPLLLDRPAEVRPEALFAVLTRGDVPGAWGEATTTVRSIGGRLAARFAPDPVAAGERLSLLVASDDGRWLGRGPVEGSAAALVGIRPPTAIRLEERATLGVVVQGPRRAGGGAGELQANPRVHLFRGDVAWRAFDAPDRHAVPPSGGTPARPEYRWLAPGPYTIVARAAGHGTVERRLDVGVDGPDEVVLTLPREEDLDRAIEGRVTSRTGGYGEALEVFAVELDPLEVAAQGRGRVAWKEENGEFVGRFRIEGLPTRAHRLRLLTADEFGNATRLSVATEPADPVATPGIPVEIVVRDDVPASDLVVRLEDAESGTPIEAFTVSLFVPDASLPPVRAQTFDGAAELTRVPALARREVLLTAGDFRPRRLPFGTLDPEEPEVTFTLRRGWGAFVVALGPDGPLPGATVLVDGVEAAVTGPDGFALLEQDVPPERIDVRHADRALVVGPETDAEGRLVARERRSGASLLFRFGPR